MKPFNEIVATNLTELRKNSGLTQQQLAQQFSYSDKTISKWELGHAIPSVDVLKDLADYYGVTIDFIVTEHESISEVDIKKNKTKNDNRLGILLLANTVWLLIATVIFVWTCIAPQENGPFWQAFVWAAAICFAFSSVFVWRWWKKEKVTWLILSSLFIWTFITAFFLQFISEHIWYIYIVGVPVEIGLVLISRMK
jgi:transcriptional regulator with XRE-family HTH domain